MNIKKYQNDNVLKASRKRIVQVFDGFEKIYISFSGGKDSSVMMHLVMDESIKRNRKVGVLVIDLEAQYQDTIKHIENMNSIYKDNIELHWACLPLLLRNAVSNYEPRWIWYACGIIGIITIFGYLLVHIRTQKHARAETASV